MKTFNRSIAALILCATGAISAVWATGCVGISSDSVDEENPVSNEDALVFEEATAPDSMNATSAPSAICGNTTLIRDSTVRSGSGSWISYGVLPGGTSVNYICASGTRTYKGYTYVQIKNNNVGYPITYGWVLLRNVN